MHLKETSHARPQLTPRQYKVNYGEFYGIGPNGNLWVEDCDVKALADRFGTPLFIISESQFRYTYRQFRDAFRAQYPDVEILFANKSSNGLAIRHIMNQEGAGGDCFGVNEMYLALLAGTNPKTLVLNGSNKQTEELEMAVQNGLCINIDAMDELDRIEADLQALRQGRRYRHPPEARPRAAGASCRGVAMHGPGTLKEQSDSTKWGMSREQTVAIIKRAQAMQAPQAEGDALPSQPHVERPDELRRDGARDDHLVGLPARQRRLDAAHHRHRRRLDLRQMVRHRPARPARRRQGADGQGLCPAVLRGDQGRGQEARPAAAQAPARAGPRALRAGRRSPSARSAPSRTATRKKWVNMDLSTNHLSWAAVLDWYYHAVPVVGADREATETVDLVGPLCNSDEVGAHRKMPPLARGDYVAFLDAGGYTESCAARYNAQLLPATVLVSGDRAEVITEREQLKDIAGRFRVPPRLLAGSFAPTAVAAE